MENSVLPTVSDSFGSIFVTAFRLFRENLALILGLFLFSNGPSALLDWLSKTSADPELATTMGSVSLIWYMIFPILAMFIVTIFIINKTKNPEESLGQTTNFAFRVLPKCFYTLLMQLIFTMLLFLLFVVPGVIYGTYWSFATMATLSTGKFGKAALMHSKELVKGRWWSTFGKTIGLTLFVILTATLIPVLLELITGTTDNVIYSITKLVSDIFLDGFTVLLFLAMYLNYEATANKTQPSANTLN